MRPLFLAAAACLAPLAPLAPLAAAAAATSPLPSLPLVREHFEALESLRSLSADFRQAVRLDGSQTIRRTSGHLEFRSPGLLRLETVSPEAQTTVIDGSSLWVYRPSTNQVVRTPLLAWRKSQPLAGSLLDVSRYAELLKSCRARIVSVGKPGPDGYRRFFLELVPKADSSGAFTLTLRLSTRDFFPAEAELRSGGVTIRSRLLNIKYNPPLPAGRFRFVPPPGADVFDASGSRR